VITIGVIKYVLVEVNNMIFPANFYILDTENESSSHGSTLILGRPFLMTARTKIDVHTGPKYVVHSDCVAGADLDSSISLTAIVIP